MLNSPLCEHTAVPHRPWPAEDMPLPRTRFNVHRKFSFRSRTVTFSLSTVDDIFELQIPRLKILRRRGAEKISDKKDTSTAQHKPSQHKTTEDDRRALRREIKDWWQELSEHMDKLVNYLILVNYHMCLLKPSSGREFYRRHFCHSYQGAPSVTFRGRCV